MRLAQLDLEHQFIPATHPETPTLLLLHGTGGSEFDLLDLGQELYPGAARLSPRGAVIENGMARFFRRISPGVFDLEDLRERTAELAAFVGEASRSYRVDPRRVIAVGYSNGANIAASLLLLHPGVLAGAVLFHAMVPIVPEELPQLGGVPVFQTAGRRDTMMTPEHAEELSELLGASGADVTLHWEPNGHALTPSEVDAAAAWLKGAVVPGNRANR